MLVTALVSGLITWLFMYLDARLFDTPKSKFTYFKGITFVSSLAAAIVYFMGSPRLPQIGGGSTGSMHPSMGTGFPMAPRSGTALVQGLNEEILTGVPSF